MTATPKTDARSFLTSSFFPFSLLILCIGLAAFAGYAKIKLDMANVVVPVQMTHSQTVPVSNTEVEAVAKLGYGGFLDAARQYMTRLDRAALVQMRQSFESARDAIQTQIKDAPASLRRDVDSALSVYSDILIRAETNGDALNSGLTQADLILASDAMKALTERVRTGVAAGMPSKVETVKPNTAGDKWALALGLAACASAALAVLMALWFVGVRLRVSETSHKGLLLTPQDMEALQWAASQAATPRVLASIQKVEQRVQDIAVQNDQALYGVLCNAEAMSRRIDEVLARSSQTQTVTVPSHSSAALQDMIGLMVQVQDQIKSHMRAIERRLDDVDRLSLAPAPTPATMIAASGGSEISRTMLVDQTRTVIDTIHDQTRQAIAREENRYDQLVRFFTRQKDSLDVRLANMDDKLDVVGERVSGRAQQIKIEETQNTILQEVVDTISKLNRRIAALDDAISLDQPVSRRWSERDRSSTH